MFTLDEAIVAAKKLARDTRKNAYVALGVNPDKPEDGVNYFATSMVPASRAWVKAKLEFKFLARASASSIDGE